ncbi:MAG: hypothetical protein ACPGWS_08450 [Solirubrobacterales bacterium]
MRSRITSLDIGDPRRRLLRRLANSVKADPADAGDRLKEAFGEIKVEPRSLLQLDEFRTAAAEIGQQWGDLPEDDPDPRAIDRKKIRRQLTQIIDPANGADPAVQAQALDFKRRVLGEFAASDPLPAGVAPALAFITDDANLDIEALDGHVDALQRAIPLLEDNVE